MKNEIVMNRLRRSGLLIAVLLLSQIACQRSSRYPVPPAGSYRVETLSLTAISSEIRGAFVTPDFMNTVRAQPVLGRWFSTEDYSSGTGQVAVLGYDAWQRMFGGQTEVIGLDVMLNGRQHTIVGVMPKSFDLPDKSEIWLPEATTAK